MAFSKYLNFTVSGYLSNFHFNVRYFFKSKWWLNYKMSKNFTNFTLRYFFTQGVWGLNADIRKDQIFVMKEWNSKFWPFFGANIITKRKISFEIYLGHSMASANLNKSEELVTNTTAASKNTHRRPRICINWNPLSGQNLLSKSTSKCEGKIYLIQNSFWKTYEVRSKRRDFISCDFEVTFGHLKVG